MKHHLLFGAAVALVATACAGAPDTTRSPTNDSPRLSRADAVSAAQRDAGQHFGFAALSSQSVSRAGSYWVVELGAPDGSVARYAIADDGSIRERRMRR
jgi:hypothetical protein